MLNQLSPFLLALAAITTVSAAGGSGSTNYYSFAATSGTTIRGRWGHAAAYIPGRDEVYFTGGQVVPAGSSTSSSGVSITNEILRLDLSTSGAQPSTDSSSASFPASAFHSVAYDAAKTELVSFGGLTADCTLAPMMGMNIGSGSSSWSSINVPGLVRRRGHAQAYLPGSDDSMVIVGGVADRYVCASSTYAYPAWDVVNLAGTTSGSVKTKALSSSLVGGSSAPVADFSLTRINASSSYSLLLAGGSDASGALIGFDTVATYNPSSETWTSVQASGDIPEARAGHSMVQHPSLSELLILHGGSISSSSSSATLAFLNTTSWTWSTPANLQPPAADGRAWHSAVMTDAGVMIVAFGLGNSGQARSDVTFLDMRNSDSSKWGWKSVWSTSMLEDPTSTTSSIPTTNVASTAEGSSSNETKKRASIAVPVVLVFCLLVLPALIWFSRRHIREFRHRRMARNYEMENDNGDSSTMGRWVAALGKMVPGNKRRSLTPRPYGGIRLADETEGRPRFFASPMAWIRSRRSKPEATSSEKPSQWEEIDFGLGKVDESRRPSTHANRTPAMREVSMTDAEKAARKASLRVTFAKDHQLVAPFRSVSTPMTTPQSVLEYPTLQPVETRSPQHMGSPTFASPQQTADWNSLADAVSSNPPFKQAPASVTVLPPLEFQRRPSAPLFGPTANRRLSEGQLLNPFAGRDALAARRPSSTEPSQSTPISSSLVDALGISTTPRDSIASSIRRSSNPPPTPPPGEPLPRPPSSASNHTKRSSKDSQLRVINRTPSPSNAPVEWK